MKLYCLSVLLSGLLLAALSRDHLYGQTNDSAVKYNEHIGKIKFSETAIQEDKADSANFLSRYTLTNRSNLFISVFLEKPLTGFLSFLAPDLSTDSLAKIGNYQFSFYVDEHLIYQTELIPGAPLPPQQQTETFWSRPLIDNQHEGALWSQSAWNRFMYNGGDNALTDGKHRLRIELRPYVKTPQMKVGDIIASGQLPIQVNRKVIVNVDTVELSSLKPYTGLEISTDDFDSKRIRELKANIEADVFKHISSVVILKKGKILVEEYFNGATRDSLHDVRSVGKSFASTLTGIAINEGYLHSEHQTLKEFYDLETYDHFSTAKGDVSLKDLLTMSANFDGDDDDASSPGNEEFMYPTDDWVKFTLGLPMDTVKYAGQWHYFTAGVMLLGNTLNDLVPNNLEDYAEAKLFVPMHITEYQWQYTPQRVVSTAGGIRMKALDLAKYGQLYQNKGSWKGKQLVPKSWIGKTFTKHEIIPDREEEYYGYLFWNKTYQSDGKSYETFYCSGNGGNKIFVFTDEPLVVVITATAYGQAYAHSQADKIIEQFVIPAILR
ncbi:serine hydrolase [Olivibacter sp. SDN3]|uniref:serine hydrolase domain-containing protein n=1 Tax=Olivibacter sp. SDN3 TaxID=2764720 RepID=UPI0016511105|nr:serine hydrolase domain-containing protein [Olivibacter sp. SDN3]QNL47847.1 serine hydrolase [Olivibacter sp. SDN3]